MSCNSSMSKCNKTEDEEEYGPQPGEGGQDRGAPLMDAMFAKQPGECPPPPPPPNGNLSCSNPDLVQVTFTIWDTLSSAGRADKVKIHPIEILLNF